MVYKNSCAVFAAGWNRARNTYIFLVSDSSSHYKIKEELSCFIWPLLQGGVAYRGILKAVSSGGLG
jgi:hypothetical protein